MTTNELVEKLMQIMDVHPEARDAQVWGDYEGEGFKFPVLAVGWDKRHRPHRVKVEG